MATITYDTFTGSAGTVLTSHTGETGATWSAAPGNSGTPVLTPANRLRNGNGGGFSFYTASGTPSSTDYGVEAQIYVASIDGGGAGIFVRAVSGQSTFYRTDFYNGDLKLYKCVGGSYTQINTKTYALTAGQTYTLRFESLGVYKRVLINGVVQFVTKDASAELTGIGKAGIFFYNNGSDSTSYHIDSFKIFDDADLTPIPRSVAFDGNSLTVGYGAVGAPYTALTMATLGSGYFFAGSAAVSGQSTPDMISRYASTVAPVYDSDLPDNILVAWEITNDLYWGASHVPDSGGATKEQAFDNFKSYCQTAQATGFTVFALTVTPRGGGSPPGFETNRQWINAKMRAEYLDFADFLVDVGGDSRIGDVADLSGPNYSDIVHMTDAGYAIVAEMVSTAILAAIAIASGALTLDNVTITTAQITAAPSSGGALPHTRQWHRSLTSGFTPGPSTALAGETSLTLNQTGLTPATTYYYKLVSTDAAAVEAISDELVVTTNAVFVAGTPTVLAVTATTVSLGTTVPTGGETPYSYQWHRSLTSGFTPDGSTAIAGAVAATTVDTGRSIGVTYYYKVVYTDNDAYELVSSEVSANAFNPPNYLPESRSQQLRRSRN